MRVSSLELLRCPACGGELTQNAPERLVCASEHVYEVDREGIPHLVHPPRLLPSDAEFQEKYDAGAEAYDSGIAWMWKAFGADEGSVRAELVDLLELRGGERVLETGCGTGNDSLLIAERIGGGELVVQDLSIGMLRIARKKLERVAAHVEYVLSNASYLPFADDTFDAAFHFGGINTFGEVRRALAEMARVVKTGGKVVIGDEGVAPWQRRRLIGRVLVRANPLYAHRPPLADLPETALGVRVRWIIGNAFYVIDYRVGERPPAVDLDLPIPGKGDTLRSRYYGAPSVR